MYRDGDQRDFARELRTTAQPAERLLWHFLRAEKLGVKFRRQAAIGDYVVDFVCYSQKLVVELDGPQHLDASSLAHDARRTAWLTSEGFRVVRFGNHELDEDIWHVVDVIKRALADSADQTQSESP